MKIGTFKDLRTRICKYCNEEFRNTSGSEFANHV
jgi:hypothetical protein